MRAGRPLAAAGVALVLAAAMVVPSLPTHAVEARRPSEMINGTPRPDEGEWLLEPFIEAIDELHYWEEAGAGFRAMYARIAPEQDSGWSLCYGSWTESLGCLWMSASGLLDARVHVEGGYELRVPDHRKLVLSYGEDRDLAFRYVGESQTWLAHKILGGEYKDARGQRYSFNSRGNAIFAGRQATYSIPVGNDRDFAPHTLIVNGKPHRYEFDGKLLKVWEIPEDPSLPAPEAPVLDLRLTVPADAIVLPNKPKPKKKQ